MAGQKGGKWRGEVTEVIAESVDKVWPILTDFGGLHKLFPQIYTSCETVEGEVNKVGALRALTAPLPDGSGFTVEARERLLSLDDINHTTSYTVESINLGWIGYKGGIDTKSVENGQTLVIWTFEVDPVDGQTEEQFVATQGALLKGVLDLTKELLAK